jgi:hypothetical protein
MVKEGLIGTPNRGKDDTGVFASQRYALPLSKEVFKKIAALFLECDPLFFLHTTYAQRFLRCRRGYLLNYHDNTGLRSFYSRGLKLSPTFAKFLIFENSVDVALMSSLLLSHCHIGSATITLEKEKIETSGLYYFTAALFTSLIVDAMKYPQLRKPIKFLLEGGPLTEADGKIKLNNKGEIRRAPTPQTLYKDFGFLKPRFHVYHEGKLEVHFDLP